MILFPHDAAKYPVDKAFQLEKSFFRRQLHRLVDHRCIRNAVHEADLIDRHPQQRPDHRLAFMNFCF